MECPHCHNKIEMSPALWSIWYREGIRQRVIIQTGNASLADLVAPKGAGGPVGSAMQAIEQFVGAMCVAYGRDTQKGKELLADGS